MTLSLLAILSALFFAQPAPGKINNFRLNDLDNRSKTYADLKGKRVTVLDFWATWCKPCVRSIPKLVKLHEQYKARGVQVLGINVDGTRNLPKVKPMAHALGISYPVLLDVNGQVATELKITQIPTLFLIDQNDEIVAIHQGYRPGDEAEWEREIQKLLPQP